MSLNAMTTVAIAQRTDDLGKGELPATAREQSQAAMGSEATETTASSTLKPILTYIPTAIVALYIAALAAVRAGQTRS
jgi:hypothetical protein